MSADLEFSPAKLNLFLAVTGRRPDGYHNLLSVAAPLCWGDQLAAATAPSGADALTCADPEVPTDASNLILRAAAAFRAAGGRCPPLRFTLEKKIPIGAGLGGGSSNAVAALRLLERAGSPLASAAKAELAAGLGSDCPLFLPGGPVILRGRGERVAPLPAEAAGRLRGRRVLVFKPAFSIATAWAYAHLAPGSGKVAAESVAEERLETWIGARGRPAEQLLFNDFARPVFAKFPALPALLDLLQTEFSLSSGLSGSGSACFALLPDRGGPSLAVLDAAIRGAWGASALIAETVIA